MCVECCGERDRDRETETETDRQTVTERERERERERETDRQTERQRDRETERDRERETETEREREREREREIHGVPYYICTSFPSRELLYRSWQRQYDISAVPIRAQLLPLYPVCGGAKNNLLQQLSS